jgi:polyhydroxybutyrate depolymerase
MVTRFILCLLCAVCSTAQGASISRRILVGQHERTYALYVPASLDEHAPAPLVIAFHGGGGDGHGMAELTGFSELADREGFLLAYPNGLKRHWSDGREFQRKLPDDVDDVAFVEALLADVAKFHAVDAHRIYATGMSNGGIFSHYLALKLSPRIAAIGVVAGGVAPEIAKDFKPADPVSVMIIHGRSDPIVPFGGGPVARTRGNIVPTTTAAKLWRDADGLTGEPKRQSKPARASGDCAEEWQSWSGGRGGSAVTFIALDGGGHTWPAGKPYLPALIIGKVCPELNATQTIWEFFKQHPKP